VAPANKHWGPQSLDPGGRAGGFAPPPRLVGIAAALNRWTNIGPAFALAAAAKGLDQCGGFAQARNLASPLAHTRGQAGPLDGWLAGPWRCNIVKLNFFPRSPPLGEPSCSGEAGSIRWLQMDTVARSPGH